MPIVESRDRPSPPFANKRRIITPENDSRDYPGANGSRGSPRHQQHGLGLYSNGEAYPASARGVLYHPEPLRSPVFDPTRAGEYRANPYPPRERGSYPEYPQSQYPPPQYDQAPPGYSSPVYAYGYDSRGKHLQERSAYPPGYHAAEYTHGHHEPYLNDLGAGQVHDLKGPQRKRRGNLPKETTDKLRSWFVAHLHHPYPTEDEKQELMMQTGLQMSEFPHPSLRQRRVADRTPRRPDLKLVHQRPSPATPNHDQQRPRRVRRPLRARTRRGQHPGRVGERRRDQLRRGLRAGARCAEGREEREVMRHRDAPSGVAKRHSRDEKRDIVLRIFF